LGIALGLFSYILEDWLERVSTTTFILKDKVKLLEACKNANLTKEATNRLILKYIDGLKAKEIAELENVEELTISQSIRRSRRKLNI
jgi:DNA-directed RNA polymerase specialized sigma24 family protein